MRKYTIKNIVRASAITLLVTGCCVGLVSPAMAQSVEQGSNDASLILNGKFTQGALVRGQVLGWFNGLP